MKIAFGILVGVTLGVTVALAQSSSLPYEYFAQELKKSIETKDAIVVNNMPSYLCHTHESVLAALPLMEKDQMDHDVMEVAQCVFLPPSLETVLTRIYAFEKIKSDACYAYVEVSADSLDTHTILDFSKSSDNPEFVTMKENILWLVRTHTGNCAS